MNRKITVPILESKHLIKDLSTIGSGIQVASPISSPLRRCKDGGWMQGYVQETSGQYDHSRENLRLFVFRF